MRLGHPGRADDAAQILAAVLQNHADQVQSNESKPESGRAP